MSTAISALKQRAEYTHKHNLRFGRHGWLRLTPAYSVKIVEDLIGGCTHFKRILDPFCGTATTALSAAYHGHKGITIDINPFLIWLGQAKTAHYSESEIVFARHACAHAVELLRTNQSKLVCCPPPIHNIDRWWSPGVLTFLCALKGALESTTETRSAARTLLTIAFCRTLISLSNAAFNHQSMSFKQEDQFHLNLDIDMPSIYERDVDFVLEGSADNPPGSASVYLGDSRNPATSINEPVDLVVTSPPYANRMSYIRELRPYMYWLGYLTNGRDAGDLDWLAIGGTCGSATSKLVDWRPSPHAFKSKILNDSLDRIAQEDNKNGKLLATYIEKYFEDMWSHFRGLIPVLARGAELHYIVGNSTFYSVLLPVEKLYEEMLRNLGFSNVASRALRKRNSKKELVEFDVTAAWLG